MIIASLILTPVIQAQDSPDATPTRRLGVVATAHLDTQWRWTIKNTIEEYIPNTLHDNFKLFDVYPDYTFSFEGAFRYMLIREYYPEDYARLKKYIADGRWRVTGSWVDAVDVNIPSFESLVRHTLYGNAFYKKEFGKQSSDIFMPDCFGFGFALPSIANHCGLKSFSTQKLTWGCSVDIPFAIGMWQGVDGSEILAGLRTGNYASELREDLSRDTLWGGIIERLGERSGCYAGYRYFGTGDVGGSPDSLSVDWLTRSIHSDGPIEVTSIGADDLPALVAEYPNATMPKYVGELVMTRHGVGCYTSQAAMKRWNRSNELLADAAERAAVTASLLGGYSYPRETFKQTWIRFLWHQFHDDLTGTSIPEAYEYSWSDELLSLNQFSTLLSGAVSAITPALDTRGEGISYVVYNPLSIAREDVVELSVPDSIMSAEHLRVYGPDDKEVPSQLVSTAGDSKSVIFRADLPSVGFAVHDVRPSSTDYSFNGGVIVTDSTLENGRYRLTLNADGDVASIFDLLADREMLTAPIEWQLIFDKPKQWPAWEIQYEDLQVAPRAVVAGTPVVEIVEAGPVRGALRVTRQYGNSNYQTTIRMAAGTAGDRIDFVNEIDWAEKETLLKVAFKPTFANDSVTYALGLGTITRGVNTEKKYEVPGHPWADLTARDGSYGLSVMSDCKYGWDHPDSGTLRLTLIHTPGVFDSWNWVGDQSSQDIGHHRFTFSVAGHTGKWSDGDLLRQASGLIQPPTAFEVPRHKGPLGKTYSLLRLDGSGQVMVNAVKMAEESDEVIVRVSEFAGKNANDMTLTFDRPVLSVREINGQEEEIGKTTADGARFGFALTPYQPKAFAVRLAGPDKAVVSPLASAPVELPYDMDGISLPADRTDGDLDGRGNTLAGELLPSTLNFENVEFSFGSTAPGTKNVVTCASQRLVLPRTDGNSSWSDLYLLLLATGGPAEGTFLVQGDKQEVSVPVSLYEYTEPMGQWNNRLVSGRLVSDASEILPAYINQTPVAWAGTHRHNSDGKDDIYTFTYVYARRITLPRDASTLVLPDNPNIKLLAASVAGNQHDLIHAARVLYDTATTSIARIQVSAPVFIDSAVAQIISPTPGASLRYTVDGSEPTINSQEYVQPFVLTESTTVMARAFDESQTGGVATKLSVKKLIPRPPVAVEKTTPGLLCSYYEGEWEKLPDFDSLPVVGELVMDSVVIPDIARPEDYGLVFRGFIGVPTDGLYEFGISSDDGSILFVADTLVADNDGLHGDGEVVGRVALQAGLHPLEVKMFQCKGGQALRLFVTGPGLEKQEARTTMLVH
jgi:alpha-mannosidase